MKFFQWLKRLFTDSSAKPENNPGAINEIGAVVRVESVGDLQILHQHAKHRNTGIYRLTYRPIEGDGSQTNDVIRGLPTIIDGHRCQAIQKHGSKAITFYPIFWLAYCGQDDTPVE